MIRRLFLATMLAAVAACWPAGAQHATANYDEAKVPAYTLPDPLVLAGGQRVRDAATWQKRRRPSGRRVGRPA